MALPYYLTGRIDEEGTFLRHHASHYRDHCIKVVQDRVVGVDPKTQRLSLEHNGSLGFDRLLIATGSTPMRAPIEGIDLPGVVNCWTLEDARAIARQASQGARVVLMGAGFIGSIVLEALAQRGVKLTVVEREDRMVPRMMDAVAGGMLKRWCESKGVQILCSHSVEAIEQAGSHLAVHLQGGEALPADLVISATGVQPNVAFLEGSGINTDRGILVNRRLQTNQAGIYAAGDVCQGLDFSTGEYSVQAIQPTAADHGRIAAMNMAERTAEHQGSVNMNVLDTLGLISSSFALWMGVDGGDAVQLCDEDNYRYLNLQFQEDRLVGAQAVGWTHHVGVLRGLIQTRLRLGKWQQRLKDDPTRIMEAYLGCTQAVGHNAGLL